MTEKTFDPYDFKKTEIDGVPVYHKFIPWAPCIHLSVVFNTGAFSDPVGKEGLSHFLEHMIFDGSPILPTKKAVREWSKKYALNTWNAWTSHENTVYLLKCLPEHYSDVLSGMKDMIFYSNITEHDVEHERKVITQEAWNRFQNEKHLIYTREIIENIYHGHTHERLYTSLGWPDTILKITREDISGWHKKYYGIGNFSIVMAGNIEEKNIEMLREFVKDLPQAETNPKRVEKLGKPKVMRFVKTADEIGEVKEQVEISAVRVFDAINKDYYETSRLFAKHLYDILHERLREEKGLCYSVHVAATLNKSYSQAVMSVKTDEPNIEIVEQEFNKILAEVKAREHVERFEVSKKVYLDQVKSAELLTGDIANSTVDEIAQYDGYIVTQQERIESINKVQYDDVVKFAALAFDPEYTHIEIILPSKKV